MDICTIAKPLNDYSVNAEQHPELQLIPDNEQWRAVPSFSSLSDSTTFLMRAYYRCPNCRLTIVVEKEQAPGMPLLSPPQYYRDIVR